jgi:hypothetical protein
MALRPERVQQQVQRLRQAGVRPVQLWVPDSRSPGFDEECRRQSATLADDPLEHEALEWLQSVADDDGWRCCA